MKVRVTALRVEGVILAKNEMETAPVYDGALAIVDRHDDYLHRMVKLATLANPLGQQIAQLIEPHIIWAKSNRFVLTGFERVQQGERNREYAQSWLCILQIDQSVDASASGHSPSSRNHRYQP